MNKITFPGLGLNLNINRVAFEFLGYKIYWYAILIVISFILAIIIFKLRDGKFGIKFEEILDLCIFIIPISFICARIYYVLFKIDYYIINPLEIFNIRGGGLAIYGGIIGGIITCYIYCKKKKIIFLNLLDYIAPTLALRTVNRQMGKLYKSRGIWNRNYLTMENGNNKFWKIYRSSSNFFIRINSNYYYICNTNGNF